MRYLVYVISFPMSPHELLYTSETASPASRSASKSGSVFVLEDNLEEQSHLGLVDEEEQSTSSWTKALFGRRTNPPCDLDAIATRRSVFDDPHLAPFYWPKKDYENTRRFDPSARWTYKEEKASAFGKGCTCYPSLTIVKALLRKIDWKIMAMAAISFSALNLDRSNLNQANSASFLSDLHLTTNGNSRKILLLCG